MYRNDESNAIITYGAEKIGCKTRIVRVSSGFLTPDLLKRRDKSGLVGENVV